ncbi:Uncharacterized conserved protein YjgD, DUF1641 family [Alteribacillus persepolensis]|uniref:Uncharacterized conserved protein YjgD, DUF1641 family n=1 Tax=Alteribacillus persepolensis TaxID=568899 RepID=A0A1G8DTE4_9BACI|nr:DUF1641 domain-containing protein [Alteribacillus persepolensis]SDH60957.1 Uncharacterized conserved protein YjgD, DUF1641 family [Alteribacillus persepolensis]
MAKAITQINVQKKTEEERQRQLQQDLLNQLTENHQSLDTIFDIVDELNKAGVLDMVKGFLRMRDQIGSISIEKVNQPSMHHLIKNGFHAIEFIGKLEPEKLEKMMDGLVHGLDRMAKETEKQEEVSMWKMFKLMRDPHVLTALSYLTAFLNGMGEELGTNRQQEGR